MTWTIFSFERFRAMRVHGVQRHFVGALSIGRPANIARKDHMPTDEQTRQREQRKQEREVTLAVIAEQVMGALGEPARLQRVNVRRLWKNHYRVNVLVGADASSATVANSYFLVTDDGGTILESAPRLVRPIASANRSPVKPPP
jgi:hypothetical protein